MAVAEPLTRELDYSLCRYGTSRLAFRGPRKRLGGSYIAILGGTETFGRYVEDPFPEILEDALGVRCVNFGQPNAGPDVFLRDETVMSACANAALTVMQITGAHNLSNRFYSVHPRRNDRFVNVTQRMRKIYPCVDFTEFHFTRHMLSALEEENRDRFRLVRDEIRRTWVARMNQISARIRTRLVLFWLGDRTPDDAGDWIADGEPLFVTRRMLDSLRGRIADVVELPPVAGSDLAGKLFRADEAPAAMQMPGPEVHEALAAALRDSIRDRGLLG